MARTRRQMRKGPQIIPPKATFRTIVIAMIAFVGLVAVFIILSFSVGRKSNSSTTSKVRFDLPEAIPDSVVKRLDAILVLGGGLPARVDEPPIFTQKRCDHAVQVVERYQKAAANLKRKNHNNNNGLLPVLCLSAGTAHLPQLLSTDGLPVWEATSSAAYLLKNYPIMNKSQLYVETTSYDTIGNAFYARTSFTDIIGWRNLLVITNEFHMDRTQVIFDWIFGLDIVDPRDAYHLYYLAPPNDGLSETAVNARKKREAQSQKTVEDILAPKYESMKGVWSFLTQEHALYTAHKLVDRGHGQSDSATAQGNESVDLRLSYGLNNLKKKIAIP